MIYHFNGTQDAILLTIIIVLYVRYDNIINYYKSVKVSEVIKGIISLSVNCKVFKRLKCHLKTKMSVKKST